MKERTISLRLTPLSPIHIGSHTQQLRGGTEFIQESNRCYVVDEEKLVHHLEKAGRLEEFISRAGVRGFNLRSFLTLESLDKERRGEVLSAISCYSSSCPVNGQRVNQIRPFMRDAYGQPYVPGTAVKGAVRTALLYCLLKERKKDSVFWKGQMDRIRDSLHSRGSPERKRKTLGDFLQEFLQDFDLYYDGEKVKPQPDRQQTDLLRNLSVSDLPPLGRDSLDVKEVRIVSLTQKGKWKFSRQRRGRERIEIENPIIIYPECLTSGQLELQTQINPELWEQFRARHPQTSIKELIEKKAAGESPGGLESDRARKLIMGLLSCCHEFARDILSQEKEFFASISSGEASIETVKNFYDRTEKERPNLRIGWGSGMLAAGIFSLIEDNDIIEAVARLFPQYRWGRLPYGIRRDRDSIFALFPKTRRVLMERGTLALPLGWAKLEVL